MEEVHARTSRLDRIEVTEIRSSAGWPRRVESLILQAGDWLYRTPHGPKKKVELSIRIVTPHPNMQLFRLRASSHLLASDPCQRQQPHPLGCKTAAHSLDLLPSTQRYELSACGSHVSWESASCKNAEPLTRRVLPVLPGLDHVSASFCRTKDSCCL